MVTQKEVNDFLNKLTSEEIKSYDNKSTWKVLRDKFNITEEEAKQFRRSWLYD